MMAGDEEEVETRLDRELIELLNELRVALPGVQVLFAFLLTVPFTNRFVKLTGGQRGAYIAALLAAAGATVFLIAPSAHHRLRFRQHDKERVLRWSNRMMIAGLLLLAGAVSASVFLVTDLMYETAVASMITAAVAGVFAVFWYALPLSRQVGNASGRQDTGAAGASRVADR